MRYYQRSLKLWLVFSLLWGASATFAETVTIPLTDLSGNVKGSATIINNPFGPDHLSLSITRALALNTRHTVFLTNSPQLGDLPAHILGEFRSAFGNIFTPADGVFSVQTEIFNAFASHNDVLENEDGIARPDLTVNPPAGLRRESGGFANTIPLNFIRIYQAEGTISVFGGSENEVGGPNVIISAAPIPESGPVVAYLQGGISRSQRAGDPGAHTSRSLGDIVDHTLEFITPNNQVLYSRSVTSGNFGFTPAVGCSGQQYTARLTVTDVNGNIDSFDQLVTVTRTSSSVACF